MKKEGQFPAKKKNFFNLRVTHRYAVYFPNLMRFISGRMTATLARPTLSTASTIGRWSLTFELNDHDQVRTTNDFNRMLVRAIQSCQVDSRAPTI